MKNQIVIANKSIKHKEEITSLNIMSVLNGKDVKKIYIDKSSDDLIGIFNKPEKFHKIYDIFDNTIVVNRDMVTTIDCIVATKVTLDKPILSSGLTRTTNWFFGECEVYEGIRMTNEGCAKPILETEDYTICG